MFFRSSCSVTAKISQLALIHSYRGGKPNLHSFLLLLFLLRLYHHLYSECRLPVDVLFAPTIYLTRFQPTTIIRLNQDLVSQSTANNLHFSPTPRTWGFGLLKKKQKNGSLRRDTQRCDPPTNEPVASQLYLPLRILWFSQRLGDQALRSFPLQEHPTFSKLNCDLSDPYSTVTRP